MALDVLSRSFYALELKHVFADSKATSFQDFFANLMSLRYPDDFVRVTTWGAKGDLKNDGFLKSEKKLFAVYAPRELTLTKGRKKITADYEGAVTHWSAHYEEWVFVHNSRDGLGAPFLQLLLDLEKQHKKPAREWGYGPVSRLVFQLRKDDLVELFGHTAPTMNDYIQVSFDEIRDVLAVIAKSEAATNEVIRPVPAEKVEKVGLSNDAKHFLKLGMQRADRVAAYFRDNVDPLKGDRIAKTFKQKYQQLVATEDDSDIVLMDLRDYASGIGQHSTKHEAATWAVIAYLFERCEIFTIEEERTS